MGKKFQNGQKVTHRTWKNKDGRPLTGTVWEFPTAAPDEAQAEVQWHDTCVADELCLVERDID